jgi:hypothetical protein
MILACWRPRWHSMWTVEAGPMWCKIIYPGEPLWGSACSCRVAPIHFQPPINGLVLRLPSTHVFPPPPYVDPELRVVCNEKRTFFPVNRRGAQHAPVVWLPFTFSRNIRPGFKLPPYAHADLTVAVVGDEEDGLPGELIRAQHAVVSS